MKTLTGPIARILYGLPLIMFGYMHFANAGQMTGMVWLPGGAFWVYLTGIALFLAAISFVVDRYVVYAAYGLTLFLLLTALTVHLPAVLGGSQANMSGLLKDLMLAGAALYFAGRKSEESPEPAEAL